MDYQLKKINGYEMTKKSLKCIILVLKDFNKFFGSGNYRGQVEIKIIRPAEIEQPRIKQLHLRQGHPVRIRGR